MTDYNTINLTRDGAVATISIKASDKSKGAGAGSSHTEIGHALNELRFDNSIRVVVVTSETPDFYNPPPGRPRMAGREPGMDWDLTQGMHREIGRAHV